jgi:hypothetical protein
MTDEPEEVANEIADAIGAQIEIIEIDKGVYREFTASMETDDQGVSGSGGTKEEALKDLVRAAEEVGWEHPEPITP